MASEDIPHPRLQSQLFGFTDIEHELAEQFRARTLHHSLLITGPKSIGKATLAYRFARFVLSGGGDVAEAEAQSFSLFGPDESVAPTVSGGALYMPESHGIFKRVASGSHADLLTIEPAYDAKKGTQKDEIQAEAAREIGEFLSLTAAESEYRVVIIDAADQLNDKAANALLKSIEEPPAHAFILIICHNPLSILPTIRSRCRIIKLHTPELSAFSAVLAHIAPYIGAQDYAALHALSHGSAGFALQLYANDGIVLYRSVLQALTSEPSIDQTIALARALTSKKSPDAWMVAKHVLITAIERALLPAEASLHPIFEGEGEYVSALDARLGRKRLLGLRDKALALLRETDVLNLDHTQAMTSLLKAA